MANASINQLRSELSDLLPLFPEEYKRIFADKKASAKVRLGAMQDLMDRLGLVAVKGTVSKNLNVVETRNLQGELDELLDREEQVTAEIQELRTQLEAPNAAYEEGSQNQAEDEEDLREGEG